jgi:hypothetical protein
VLLIAGALIATLGVVTRTHNATLAAVSPVLLALPLLPYYADVPLAMYFLLAAVLFAAAEPALAGLCASLAAWTKDEGLAFSALFFLVVLLLRRRAFLPASATAAPILAAMLEAFARLGGPNWYHPAYPLLILLILIAFGIRRDTWRNSAFTAILVLGMTAAYITTPYDFRRQLSTSVDRLAIQSWPLIALTLFLAVNPPRRA